MADIHQLFDGMIATGHSNDQNGSPARPPDYSDEALANRFTARHRDDLRFVNSWGRPDQHGHPTGQGHVLLFDLPTLEQ